MNQQDVVILGGGAAGLVVASGLSQLGLKVTLIEKNPFLGGDCLHTGCVPSKTLIHLAFQAHTAKKAAKLGMKVSCVTADMKAVSQHIKAVIEHIQHHDDPARFESYGVKVVFGEARFIDQKSVQVGAQVIEGRRFVIATGSSPMVPPIPGLQDLPFLTNESIFGLQELPNHLVVLGAGPVGVELAQAMSRLGSKVTVLDRNERVLTAFDEEATTCLHQVLSKEGIELELGCQVLSCQGLKQGIEIKFKSKDKDKTLRASHVLVATGQKPNLDLNLLAAGVRFNARGIEVDRRLRTSNKRIFALGDVIDSPLKLTHVAEYQAGVVIANLAFRWPKKQDLSHIPLVVYSDPEVAQVGQIIHDKKNKAIQSFKINFSDIDRAIVDDDTEGFMRLWLHKKRIVGALIVGPKAGELIAEISLAIKLKAKVQDISNTVHAYPTLSQIHRRLTNQYFAPKLFSPFVKKVVRWCQKLP